MKQDRISQKDFFFAAGLAVLSTLCVAIAAGLWQYLTTLGTVRVVLFARFFFPLALIGIWMLIARLRVHVHSIWPHLLRSVLVVLGQYALLYVLAHSSLLLAILLYSTSGLFAPILMFLFLRVRASNKAIISIVISFIGVAIALGTWHSIFASISWIGLSSGLLAAAAQIIQHRTSKSDSSVVTNLVLFGFCSLLALGLVVVTAFVGQAHPLFQHHLSLPLFGVILGFSVLTLANQTLKTAAFKRVKKATTLAPFLYASIIFSGVIDWLWYGIIPEFHTVLGVCIIILGAAIMSVRRMKPS